VKEFALGIQRDVPLFWGIGDHGGGPAMEDLEKIDQYISKEKDVRIIHSTTENIYKSLKGYSRKVPVVEGELQRVFTGCYSSISRIKRKAAECSSAIVQAEALRTVTSLFTAQKYPAVTLDQCWRDALLNDFHDIITGTCIEPAEKDALDLYGKVIDEIRHIRLSAAFAFNKGKKKKTYIPLTLLNANPLFRKVPVETECMLDLRPKWSGEWHLKLFTIDGIEIPCQEIQPESLLPFNQWRRKICFMVELPPIGAKKYKIEIAEGPEEEAQLGEQAFRHTFDYESGLINHLATAYGQNLLSGHLFKPLIMDDDADSWGTGRYSYREITGVFEYMEGSCREIEHGPVRIKTESVFSYKNSSIVIHTISYKNWPFLEFRFRIRWNEKRKMLKLSIPTKFSDGTLLCEIPGGAIRRPADGKEHVQGRWSLLEGIIDGKQAAIGIVNSGQHGIDFYNGELRLTVLRSVPYCHERGLKLDKDPSIKYMDQGIHEFRLLVTAGKSENIRGTLAGAAEWLSAPPVAYPHLPIRVENDGEKEFVLNIFPDNIHMTALKMSSDGKAFILRLHETVGRKTKASVDIMYRKKPVILAFAPFEIKTLRIGKKGECRQVDMIKEV
jgi:alpha-mannosidase